MNASAGSTVKVTGHVYEMRYPSDTKSTFIVLSSNKMADDWYTYVGPLNVDYTIPADYNPTAQQIAALQAKRDAAAREFAATVKAIDERLSKLQAISFDGVAA